MKKTEQLEINAIVEHVAGKVYKSGMQYIGKLRYCNAEVWSSDDYYILRSYNTLIAAIDSKGNLYDFLRLVYGYTTTSASHIAKFAHDFRGTTRFTWRKV